MVHCTEVVLMQWFCRVPSAQLQRKERCLLPG